MTSFPVLAILKLQHEKVRISVKNKLMSKISSYARYSSVSDNQLRTYVEEIKSRLGDNSGRWLLQTTDEILHCS